MIRTTSLIAIAVLASACQPQKTPEQIAAEQQAEAMQEFAKGMASALGQTGPNGAQIDPNAMAAAMAQAGAMASVVDPNMSAEDRAKLQAITGAIWRAVRSIPPLPRGSPARTKPSRFSRA